MAKKTDKSTAHNIEITSDGNTTINGDVVGNDKVETNVNLYVQLEQNKSKQPIRKINNSKKKKDLFSSKEARRYSIIFGGALFIFSGILLFFGIITINALSMAAELSGAAGVNSSDLSEPSTVLQSSPSSRTETTVTLTSSICDANIEILNNAGDVILSIVISPDTSQTISLPAGNYTYNVKYYCGTDIAGTAGMPRPIDYSRDFYLPSDGDVKIGSPDRPKIKLPKIPVSLDQFIGFILIIIGSRLLSINGKKTTERNVTASTPSPAHKTDTDN